MKRATIRDVARAADVSVATVSRVCNSAEAVTPETRKRVLAAAAKLDYVPHSGARSLSSRRTDTLGVLLPDLHGEFFSELIRGIDAATRARGLHLLLSHSHGNPAEAVAVLRAMRSRIDAMLVMSPYADDAALSAAMAGAGPLVLLGGGSSERHPSLSVDHVAGAAAMTHHLLDCGNRRIAFLAGPSRNIDANERQEGYSLALTERGVAPGPLLQGDFSEASGMSAARALIAAGLPDALFAANDMMAIGALQVLRESGLKVPDDIAIAGFDDIPVSRFLDPPLTTVAVPIAEIGRQAVECCLELLGGMQPVSTRFQPTLVIRGSTKSSHHDNRRERRQLREDR